MSAHTLGSCLLPSRQVSIKVVKGFQPQPYSTAQTFFYATMKIFFSGWEINFLPNSFLNSKSEQTRLLKASFMLLEVSVPLHLVIIAIQICIKNEKQQGNGTRLFYFMQQYCQLPTRREQGSRERQTTPHSLLQGWTQVSINPTVTRPTGTSGCTLQGWFLHSESYMKFWKKSDPKLSDLHKLGKKKN